MEPKANRRETIDHISYSIFKVSSLQLSVEITTGRILCILTMKAHENKSINKCSRGYGQGLMRNKKNFMKAWDP